MQAEQVLEEADIIFSDSAAKKVADLIQEEKNENLKLRVYITGGVVPVFLTALPLMKTIKKVIVVWKITVYSWWLTP